jgi:hypothetical protein
VIDPPRVQVTAAFAVPGFVVADTFQVQDTIPSEPAVGVVLSPAAADTVLYAGSIIRPFGAATPATPAPIVSPSPVMPSPTLAPTKSAAP